MGMVTHVALQTEGRGKAYIDKKDMGTKYLYTKIIGNTQGVSRYSWSMKYARCNRIHLEPVNLHSARLNLICELEVAPPLLVTSCHRAM